MLGLSMSHSLSIGRDRSNVLNGFPKGERILGFGTDLNILNSDFYFPFESALNYLFFVCLFSPLSYEVKFNH